MKPSNSQQRNLPKGKSIFPFFSYATVAVLTFSFILLASIRSYAEDPSAAIILPFGGNVAGNSMVVREGTERNVKPWARDKKGHLFSELRRFRDTLEIAGNTNSGANLSFITENTVVIDHAGLIARTVPSKLNTEYRFPCGLARGYVTIGWRKAGESADRACNNGLRVGPGVGKQSYLQHQNYGGRLQASKNLLFAQSSNDVTVVPPDSGSRLVQVVADENAIETITLEGDILVKSDKHPEGRPIPEGNQYSYPKDTITPINCQEIGNSNPVQELLNPNNWSFSDIPQRVTDGIANQITDHRAALCRASGSPVWTLDRPNFSVGQTCSIAGRLNTSIVQTGSSLSVDYSYFQTNSNIRTGSGKLRGTITDTKVQMLAEPDTGSIGYSMVFDGTLTPNGEIVGTVTVRGGPCNGLSGPFKMTR